MYQEGEKLNWWLKFGKLKKLQKIMFQNCFVVRRQTASRTEQNFASFSIESFNSTILLTNGPKRYNIENWFDKAPKSPKTSATLEVSITVTKVDLTKKWIYPSKSVADPGFPVGGGEGRQPLTLALFGKNVCENERIGSCWGGGRRRRPLGSANANGHIIPCIHVRSFYCM